MAEKVSDEYREKAWVKSPRRANGYWAQFLDGSTWRLSVDEINHTQDPYFSLSARLAGLYSMAKRRGLQFHYRDEGDGYVLIWTEPLGE